MLIHTGTPPAMISTWRPRRAQRGGQRRRGPYVGGGGGADTLSRAYDTAKGFNRPSDRGGGHHS